MRDVDVPSWVPIGKHEDKVQRIVGGMGLLDVLKSSTPHMNDNITGLCLKSVVWNHSCHLVSSGSIVASPIHCWHNITCGMTGLETSECICIAYCFPHVPQVPRMQQVTNTSDLHMFVCDCRTTKRLQDNNYHGPRQEVMSCKKCCSAWENTCVFDDQLHIWGIHSPARSRFELDDVRVDSVQLSLQLSGGHCVQVEVTEKCTPGISLVVNDIQLSRAWPLLIWV